MLVYEYKLDGNIAQYTAMDEAIRVTQFVRNKCLRLWMDADKDQRVNANDLQVYCSQLAKEVDFASKLNSQARQAAADRAWNAIQRFYDNCKAKRPGKKGYPHFQHDNRSVEDKTTGWKLEPDGKHIVFTDGCGIGRMRMIGTRDVITFPVAQIKRVRILKRADGYFVQFVLHAERVITHVATGMQRGIDMGLKEFYTDSEGATVENPRFLRKAEKQLKSLQRQVSRKKKGSHNRSKARKKLARAHLKVHRQREDFAREKANALVSSSDFLAYEHLQIRNMVKNHTLAKSISDASWGRFLYWVVYYAALHHIRVIAVPPQYTSQNCSGCGAYVQKSLSTRTHLCHECGLIMERDHNSAVLIRDIGLRTFGQRETGSA